MGVAAKPKIVKGDTVVLRRAKRKASAESSSTVFPKDGFATVEGLNVVKRHTKAGSDRREERRYPRERGADPVVRAHGRRSEDRPPDARAAHPPVRRHVGARLREVRRAAAHPGEGSIDMAERLKEKYQQQVRPALQERFKYANPMQVPKLEKVVINMSVTDAIQTRRRWTLRSAELTTISGQKPIITKARKSIAAFKLREGMNIGAKR